MGIPPKWGVRGGFAKTYDGIGLNNHGEAVSDQRQTNVVCQSTIERSSEMKKIIAVAAFAVVSIACLSRSADATSAMAPAQFQIMVEKIQVKQAEQRASITNRIEEVRAINARKQNPGKTISVKFLGVIEKINVRQALGRADIKNLIQKIATETAKK